MPALRAASKPVGGAEFRSSGRVNAVSPGPISTLASGHVVALLGVTGTNVVSRVLGILTAALAVQLVLDGLAEAAVLH